MSNIHAFAPTYDILASLNGKVATPTPRHPLPVPTIPGIRSVIEAAGRAVAPGRHAGARLAEYNSAEAASAMLLYRVAQMVVARTEVSDAAIDALADAGDACELAGDVAVADRQHGLAEKWYSLATRLNHDGFRALSCAQQR